MARLPIFIFLFGVLATSVRYSQSQQRLYWNQGQLIAKGQETAIPGGYQYFPNVGHYKFYPEGAMTYYQALSTCKNDGGHLAILNSEAEAQVLRKLYARYPRAKPFAWLGFTDIALEGKWETIFGQPLRETGYTVWDSTQPNDVSKGEDCGAIDRNGKFHDLFCEQYPPWPFFCEYGLFEEQRKK